MHLTMPMPLTVRPPGCRPLALVVCCLTLAVSSVCAEPIAWVKDGKATPAAHEAVTILSTAASEGLDPADYNAAGLQNALAIGNPLPADFDQALSLAVQRFLLDVQRGRIDPAHLGENYDEFLGARPDPEQVLRQSSGDQRVAAAVAAVRPPNAEYEELRAALARYHALANDPAWQAPLPPLPGSKLEPGKPWPGLARLAQRLEALGDLPARTPLPTHYEGAVVAGVRAFQQRHGLTPDGVIGKATLEGLEVTPASRVRQLALALERLRWMPQPARALVVNVPEFVLRGYDARDGRSTQRVAMNVIVGNAARTQTPIFAADMRLIEFSPYWNVPPSIARGETIPKLRRDPAYFEQQGFEFVGRDGQVSGHLSDANLEAVRSGQMRIRQRPGAKNALGDIKFVFPNSDNIYLHHTPTPKLFQRDRRDFSHGCIRVEQPVELAKFVLAGQPEWDEERIVQAMTRGRSATLQLKESLPVVIAYRTATVNAGKVHFFPDIYRRDARLSAALEQRRLAQGSSGIPKKAS